MATGDFGVKLDRHVASRNRPLRNAVGIDRKGVRHIFGNQGDPDELATRNFNPLWFICFASRRDDELSSAGTIPERWPGLYSAHRDDRGRQAARRNRPRLMCFRHRRKSDLLKQHTSGPPLRARFPNEWFVRGYEWLTVFIRSFVARLVGQAGAEIVITGHEHVYERFVPVDANRRSTSDGLRQFIVGTGGAELYSFVMVSPESEVRIVSYGILKLNLTSDGYGWEFLGTKGSILDSGSGTCH
jgi:hypothetical protein